MTEQVRVSHGKPELTSPNKMIAQTFSDTSLSVVEMMQRMAKLYRQNGSPHGETEDGLIQWMRQVANS